MPPPAFCVPSVLYARSSLLLGCGLVLADVTPTPGFALNATAWLLSAATQAVLPVGAPKAASFKSRCV